MEPIVTEKGSRYILDWPSQQVRMEVGRIKPSLKAEVKTFFQESPFIRSYPVLDSNSGLDIFWKKLNRRKPIKDYGVDWEACVEEMAGVVIDRQRKHTPTVLIKDVREEEGIQWRVDNIMVEDITLIFGDGGSGKSMMACLLASMMDSGYMSTDHNLVCEPGRVLYLDWETKNPDNPGAEIAKRINSILRGFGREPESHVVYQEMGSPLNEELDFVIDLIDEHAIDVVIIDSMGLSLGGDLEAAEPVLQWFRDVGSLNKPTLIVSHKNKAGGIFGSQYTYNSCRMVWEARKSDTGVANGVDMVMFHRKANNVPQQHAIAWHIAFEDDTIIFSRKDVMDTEESGELKIPELIYRFIVQGPIKREDLDDLIADRKGIAPDTKAFSRMRNAISTAISRKVKSNEIEVDNNVLKLPADKIKKGEVFYEGGTSMPLAELQEQTGEKEWEQLRI